MSIENPRYYVGELGETWCFHSKSFSNLDKAVKYFMTRDSKQGRIYIAKKIPFKTSINEVNGQIEVRLTGDFSSKQPYYLIRDYEGCYGDDDYGPMHDAIQLKNPQELLKRQLGSSRKPVLAHGLELKLLEDEK